MNRALMRSFIRSASRPEDSDRIQIVAVNAFAAIVLTLDLVGLLVRGIEPEPFYLVAYAVILVALLITTVKVLRTGLRESETYAYPLFDQLGVGILAVQPGSYAMMMGLVVAWWLGFRHRSNGVLVGALAGIILVAPTLFVAGWATAPRLISPLFAVLCLAAGAAATAQAFVATARAADREQRKRDQLLNTLNLGVQVFDAQGRIRASNARQRELWQLTSPEGEPTAAGEAVQFADANGSRLPLTSLPSVRAARGEQFRGELVWAGEGERARTLAVSSHPIRGAGGEFSGAVLTSHDVTDLMRALSVKDDFVASVSHELRTPLTSVLGYVEYVLDTDPDPGVREHLTRVFNGAHRLARLVEDLLHAADTSLLIRTSPVDVAALFATVEDVTRLPAARAGISLDFAVEGAAAVVDADPERLEQVVENLVTNAIKYGRRGGSVVVRCRTVGEELQVSVADDGIGMTPEDSERVFDRFFRSGSIDGDEISGVGLGLAICREIVRAHHGTITVDSTLGEGSTFTVTLPRKRIAAGALRVEGAA